MRKIYLSLLLLCTVSQLFSQGENCSAATLISNGSCVTGSAGLTQNIPGCVGTADDDVWYRFVATVQAIQLRLLVQLVLTLFYKFFLGLVRL